MCSGLPPKRSVTSSPLIDQELLVGAVQGVEAVDRGQEVVIGQHEELVAVLAIPAHDVVRRAVAVAVERVRVGVALVPAASRRLVPVGAG